MEILNIASSDFIFAANFAWCGRSLYLKIQPSSSKIDRELSESNISELWLFYMIIEKKWKF